MGIEEDMAATEKRLVEKQHSYDQVSELSRTIIRNAAQAITLLHNNRDEEASELLKKMKGIAEQLNGAEPALGYYSVQALQEYAEARIFYSIKDSWKIPKRADLGIGVEPYLLGIMDVVGELKREVLESLRRSKISEAERFYDLMKEIYDSTSRMRFAEAVLNGFRRKQDVARIQLESAGSEILFAKKMR